MKPPATIIVGEVVRLREKLNWFERLPLFGQRIVVTRARGQADALSSKLAALGADVIELPTIEIRSAADLCRRSTAPSPTSPPYDWLIFTSANGVQFFLEAPRPLRLRPARNSAPASAPSARPRAPPSKRCI